MHCRTSGRANFAPRLTRVSRHEAIDCRDHGRFRRYLRRPPPRAARELPVETHLIATRWARITIEHETPYSREQVEALATVSYAPGDMGAAISSGSFRTDGMIIAPCSMKTVSALATGFAHNLMCRAADVVLKERRPLVLAVRETPLHSIHLRNLATLSDMGVVIAPPVPAFYAKPTSLELVDYTVVRLLDQLGMHVDAPAVIGTRDDSTEDDLTRQATAG
jgi:4-hydroxy-3-polyprenylbenzoate decarboxylase